MDWRLFTIIIYNYNLNEEKAEELFK